MLFNLNSDNFLIYAAKNYISPHYIEEEFFSDIKRIKYIKSLLQKHKAHGVLKERLILNHIIMTYNVFETEACTKMLFFRVKENNYSSLKTFLVYLNYMPNKIEGIEGKTIISSSIPVDFTIARVLRKI